MIISKITGGLGNQMFQYAMGRRLAEQHGTELLLDTSNYGVKGESRPASLAAFSRPLGLSRFQIKAKVAQPEEVARLRDEYYRATTRDRVVRKIRRFWRNFLRNRSHMIETQYRFQPEALTWPDDVYLQGFWQSPKYFDDIAAIIRKELQPVDQSVVTSARKTIERIKSIGHSTVVSLHVRRGDIAHAHEALREKNTTHGAPVTRQYLEGAMEKFDPATCFFVFSDTPKDIEWCRQNIHAKNLEFSSAESDIWDFAAMTECDHHIIANSTFSWWAAWLDAKPGRRVIAPRVWSPPEARFRMVIDDLLPDDWELIG